MTPIVKMRSAQAPVGQANVMAERGAQVLRRKAPMKKIPASPPSRRGPFLAGAGDNSERQYP
jgi:hypothetical protein